MCIFLFQINIHKKVGNETDEVGWVMGGTVCAEDYTFLWKNKLSFKDRIFIHHSIILAVKRVEFVSDRMSHMLMRCCWLCMHQL